MHAILPVLAEQQTAGGSQALFCKQPDTHNCTIVTLHAQAARYPRNRLGIGLLPLLLGWVDNLAFKSRTPSDHSPPRNETHTNITLLVAVSNLPTSAHTGYPGWDTYGLLDQIDTSKCACMYTTPALDSAQCYHHLPNRPLNSARVGQTLHRW